MDHEDPTAHFALAHKGPMVHPGLYLGKMGCGAFMGWTNLVGQTLASRPKLKESLLHSKAITAVSLLEPTLLVKKYNDPNCTLP